MGPPPSQILIRSWCLLNPQQQLYKAWRIQKKILLIHEERKKLRSTVEQTTEEHTSLCTKKDSLTKSIADCSKKEEELDAQVVRYAADLSRTKEQMNFGTLDFEIGTAQVQALESKIDSLEEEYFLLVDQREGEEKEIFVVQQKIALRVRAIQEATLAEQTKLPGLHAQEEEHEEKLNTLLSRVPVEHQNHFESLRFAHANLVAHLRDSFCGACGTKQPLQIVGDLMRTTAVHICGNCKAFCIAP